MVRVIEMNSARAMVGEELGVSDWFELTFESTPELDTLAHVTSALYTDPYAPEQSPFGESVVSGLVLLGLSQRWSRQLYAFDGCAMYVELGYDRVRYPEAAGARARLRLRARLARVQEIAMGLDVVVEETIEIDAAGPTAFEARTQTPTPSREAATDQSGGTAPDRRHGRACRAERVYRLYTAHAPGVF